MKIRYALFVPVTLSMWCLPGRHLQLFPQGQRNHGVRLDSHLHLVLNLKGGLDTSGGFEVGVKNKFLTLFCRLVCSQSVCCYSTCFYTPYTPEFGGLYLAECGELSHLKKKKTNTTV